MTRVRTRTRKTAPTNEAKAITRSLCAVRILHRAGDKPIRASELADVTERAALKRMERRGLLKRMASRYGGSLRDEYLLTGEGRRVLESMRELMTKFVESWQIIR